MAEIASPQVTTPSVPTSQKVTEGLKKYWWVIVLLIAAYLFYRHKKSKKQHDDAPTASA